MFVYSKYLPAKKLGAERVLKNCDKHFQKLHFKSDQSQIYFRYICSDKIGTDIFELFVKIFNEGMDKECSKNIIDIMNGLVKVGWDCQRILTNLEQAVMDEET